MNKQRTLYITNLGLLENLAETQVLPYLEGLSKKGVSIDILSFEKKSNLADGSAAGRMRSRLGASGIGWDYLIYHNRWGNILDVISGMAKSLSAIRRRKISILHARASIPVLIAWPIARLFRIKIIYDRRGTMSGDFVDDVNVRNIFSFGFIARMIDAFESFIIRHSDAVVVLSDKALDLLNKDVRISRKGIVLETIPCCVDQSRFIDNKSTQAPDPDLAGKFIISYLGSLGTCYLLKEMVLFFKELKKMDPSAFFLIISHSDKVYIEDVLIKEGLLSGNDYRIIALKPDEVGRYLSLCKFGIMFIKPVECKVGSSPTKFAESLAAGIPVVVNKGIGDTEDIILKRKVGVVVDGFNAVSYGKSIEEMRAILKPGDLKDRCIKTAGEYFSLDLGIERYFSVYKKIG